MSAFQSETTSALAIAGPNNSAITVQHPLEWTPFLRQAVNPQKSLKGETGMMSRRTFTKEFKLKAIRRLQSGQSAGGRARAFEVNPIDLRRWRGELDEHRAHAFPGPGGKLAG